MCFACSNRSFFFFEHHFCASVCPSESKKDFSLLISLTIKIIFLFLHAEILPDIYKGEEVTEMLGMELDLHEGKIILVHTILRKISIYSHNHVPNSQFLKKKTGDFLCLFLLKELEHRFYFVLCWFFLHVAFKACSVLFIKLLMNRLKPMEFCQIWINADENTLSHCVSHIFCFSDGPLLSLPLMSRM